MIRNWYNQIPHPALKTKRETTKYINWQQFTKGTRGKSSGILPFQCQWWSMFKIVHSKTSQELCCDSVSWSEWTYGCSETFDSICQKYYRPNLFKNKQVCFWMYYLSKVFIEDKTTLARNWYSTISFGKTHFRSIRSISYTSARKQIYHCFFQLVWWLARSFCCTRQNCWYSKWFDHWTLILRTMQKLKYFIELCMMVWLRR